MSKYSELYLLLWWSLFAALAVLLFAVVPILVGVPRVLSVIAAGAALLLIPFLAGKRIIRRWDEETPHIASTHPFLFIEKARSIKRTGYFVQLTVILVLLIIVIGRDSLNSLFSDAPLTLILLEFLAVELVLLQVQLSFWAPDPFDALRASLQSEFDVERGSRLSRVDDSIEYFNRLSAKSTGLALRDQSLNVFLFGSESRSLRIYALLSNLDDREAPDYQGFMNELSEIAQKPIAEIADRAGFATIIKRNQGTILSLLGTVIPLLIALSPYIIPIFVNPVIQSWSQLFHSVH